MKKIITTLFVSIAFSGFCSSNKVQEDHFVYGSFSAGPVPIPAPGIGIGYRSQTIHHGWDANLRFSTVILGSQLKFSLNRLYYFNPYVRNSYYIGGGVGLSAVMDMYESAGKLVVFTLSPEFRFGKEFITNSGRKQFVQIELSFPTLYNGKGHLFPFPLLVLTYGF